MIVGILGGGDFRHYLSSEPDLTDVETPYGPPSDKIASYHFAGHRVVTLQRHGARHTLAPHEIPWCANVYALASLGIDFVIHITVSGALVRRYSVGDVVLFDQILDFTRTRPVTMGPPIIREVTHPDVADPFDNELIRWATSILTRSNVQFLSGGTMVCIEGPRFSTHAESAMYRKLGGHLINMSSAPEVFLLREVGIPVLGLTLVTDKDNSVRGNNVNASRVATNIGRFRARVPQAIVALLQGLCNLQLPNREMNMRFPTTPLELRQDA